LIHRWIKELRKRFLRYEQMELKPLNHAKAEKGIPYRNRWFGFMEGGQRALRRWQ